MKVFQSKHHEILLSDAVLDGEKFLSEYNALLVELLIVRNISEQKTFEAIIQYTITSKPFLTASLLRKKTLPAFNFLVCKN
jgi:hypothetical protein